MATRVRDGPLQKDRTTGISPTIPRPADPTRRRSLNPSPSRPAGSADQKHDPTSSGKRIPNYLRPTRCSSSSGLDDHSLNHGKKPAHLSDAARKPTLTRRRSFDKPPAPAQVSKPRVSAGQKPTLTRRRSFDMPPTSQVPKTRISPVPKQRTPQSSSSSSAKSTMISSRKGFSDRFSKAPKDSGEKKSISPRPVSLKRDSTGTKKQDRGASSIKMKATIMASGDRVDDYLEIAAIPERLEDDQQPLVTDEEITFDDLSNYELPEEIEVEDNGRIDPTQAEPYMEEYKNITTIESSEVAYDQEAASGVNMEEPEDLNSLGEETSSSVLETEQHFTNNSIDPTNECLSNEPKAEDQEKEEMEDANEASDKKEEVDDGSQAVNSKKIEEVKDAVKEAKQEAQDVAAKRQLPVRAKQESAISNNVIEETASKLREQRKNKVKALAGAFETVISLQELK